MPGIPDYDAEVPMPIDGFNPGGTGKVCSAIGGRILGGECEDAYIIPRPSQQSYAESDAD